VPGASKVTSSVSVAPGESSADGVLALDRAVVHPHVRLLLVLHLDALVAEHEFVHVVAGVRDDEPQRLARLHLDAGGIEREGIERLDLDRTDTFVCFRSATARGERKAGRGNERGPQDDLLHVDPPLER
jgi:hypothetical protein